VTKTYVFNVLLFKQPPTVLL